MQRYLKYYTEDVVQVYIFSLFVKILKNIKRFLDTLNLCRY
jgi:hypothetical protein